MKERPTHVPTWNQIMQEAKEERERTFSAKEQREFLDSGVIVAKNKNATFYSTTAPTAPYVSSLPALSPANTSRHPFASASTSHDNNGFSNFASTSNPNSTLSHAIQTFRPHQSSLNNVVKYGSSDPFLPSTFESRPNRTISANNSVHFELPDTSSLDKIIDNTIASLTNNSFHALQNDIDNLRNTANSDDVELAKEITAMVEDYDRQDKAEKIEEAWTDVYYKRKGHDRSEHHTRRENTKVVKMEIDAAADCELSERELDLAIASLTKALRQRKLANQWLKTRQHRAQKALEKEQRRNEDMRWELAREEIGSLRTREDKRRFLLGL
ncbi:hypothetical protein P7C70_g9391, partial [Phenoliferia sp. Uapishka_3]